MEWISELEYRIAGKSGCPSVPRVCRMFPTILRTTPPEVGVLRVSGGIWVYGQKKWGVVERKKDDTPCITFVGFNRCYTNTI